MTGGARGIGRMISEGFVRNGARVYVASRDKDACAAAVAELNALDRGGSAVSLPADLSSEAECRRLIDEIARAEGGRLHVLVNNSGAAWGARFDEYPDHAWTKVLTLNLQRVFTLTRTLVHTFYLLSLSQLTRFGVQKPPRRCWRRRQQSLGRATRPTRFRRTLHA